MKNFICIFLFLLSQFSFSQQVKIEEILSLFREYNPSWHLPISRKTPQQLQELEEIVNSTEEKQCDTKNFNLESEIAFHGKLYEMAGNELLKKFQNVLLPIFEYVHDLSKDDQHTLLFPQGQKRVTHTDLLRELKEGSPASFRELMRAHLNPHFSRTI